MKRDMELIRKILLQAEETDEEALVSTWFRVSGYDDAIVASHIELLQEAGLVKASVVESGQAGAALARIFRLTWSGHDFLDSARNQTLWKKALNLVKDKLGTASFEVLKFVLVQEAKEILAFHQGG
jgi:predicted ArsR family transcriptional regulator